MITTVESRSVGWRASFPRPWTHSGSARETSARVTLPVPVQYRLANTDAGVRPGRNPLFRLPICRPFERNCGSKTVTPPRQGPNLPEAPRIPPSFPPVHSQPLSPHPSAILELPDLKQEASSSFFFEQEEGLMELYRRETEGAIRAFHLHEITVAECRDALDSAMTKMAHRHPAQEIASLRRLMLTNGAKVAKEWERGASATALSPRLCPKRDGAANHAWLQPPEARQRSPKWSYAPRNQRQLIPL